MLWMYVLGEGRKGGGRRRGGGRRGGEEEGEGVNRMGKREGENGRKERWEKR